MWTSDIAASDLCYDREMEKIASVDMLVEKTGKLGVQISASDDFDRLPPVDRIGLLVAAIQLCGLGVNAIMKDNPDDEAEISELLHRLSIDPLDRSMN